MKILHVCETARGGIGTYLDQLASISDGVLVNYILMPDSHRDVISSVCEISLFRYPGRSVASLVRLAKQSWFDARRFKPDIIFCHSSFSLVVLLLLRLLRFESRYIYCSHGWAGTREQSGRIWDRMFCWIEGQLSGLADVVVNVSQNELDYARSSRYRGRHILIENAARPSLSQPSKQLFDSDPAVINLLFVGRLDRQKGLDILLPAFNQARKCRPELRLHIIGQSVVSETSFKEVTKDVNFLGWKDADALDAYYSSADILIAPSRWEAFGLLGIEAYRNGTPVLTSDRGALPSLVLQGKTGYSIPLSVESLAAKLAALDKSEIKAMGPDCIAEFERRFHTQRLSQEILKLYYDLQPEPT
ncbi:MAG: glycosyltransferase family 4 protein [Sphingomonadales bacterium]|nr:glycosyltransferase family 4 protein [Sphingomonadales bacterium]